MRVIKSDGSIAKQKDTAYTKAQRLTEIWESLPARGIENPMTANHGIKPMERGKHNDT